MSIKNQEYTMSVVDLSTAESLKTAIENFAGNFYDQISINAPLIWYIQQFLVQKFDDYIDLHHFASLVNEYINDEEINSSAQSLITVIDEYVIYNL